MRAVQACNALFWQGEKLKSSYLFEPSLCHSFEGNQCNGQEGILGNHKVLLSELARS